MVINCSLDGVAVGTDTLAVFKGVRTILGGRDNVVEFHNEVHIEVDVSRRALFPRPVCVHESPATMAVSSSPGLFPRGVFYPVWKGHLHVRRKNSVRRKIELTLPQAGAVAPIIQAQLSAAGKPHSVCEA